MELVLTDQAKVLLGNMGYDPVYGARPLKRVIQRQLTDKLALALLEGRVREGDIVTADAAEGELVLEVDRDGALPSSPDNERRFQGGRGEGGPSAESGEAEEPAEPAETPVS